LLIQAIKLISFWEINDLDDDNDVDLFFFIKIVDSLDKGY
jgi:hypothetical protein